MKHTADVCDAYGEAAHVLEPGFRHVGGRRSFAGPIATVQVHEDNTLVRQMLERPGEGRVLVVDGGGSLRCALVGGNLGELAKDHDWAGIVVNGAVRDSHELAEIDLGVYALATHPKKSGKTGAGSADVAVTFGGCTFRPGDLVAVDEDGLVVLASEPQD